MNEKPDCQRMNRTWTSGGQRRIVPMIIGMTCRKAAVENSPAF
jgi:hypothetical protein